MLFVRNCYGIVFLRPDVFVLQLSAFTTKASVYKALALGGQQHCFFLLFLFFPIDTPSNPASLFDRLLSSPLLFLSTLFFSSSHPVLLSTSFFLFL